MFCLFRLFVYIIVFSGGREGGRKCFRLFLPHLQVLWLGTAVALRAEGGEEPMYEFSICSHRGDDEVYLWPPDHIFFINVFTVVLQIQLMLSCL